MTPNNTLDVYITACQSILKDLGYKLVVKEDFNIVFEKFIKDKGYKIIIDDEILKTYHINNMSLKKFESNIKKLEERIKKSFNE